MSFARRPRTIAGPITVRWGDTPGSSPLTLLAVSAVVGAFLLAWLGLPPVDLHSPLHRMGIMDPLCGMTRAARALALGELKTAWTYNPGIFLLSVGAGFVLARDAMGMVWKRWLVVQIGWRRTVLFVAVVLLLALWWRQQMHAELFLESGMRMFR
jgi:hypothetical protein